MYVDSFVFAFVSFCIVQRIMGWLLHSSPKHSIFLSLFPALALRHFWWCRVCFYQRMIQSPPKYMPNRKNDRMIEQGKLQYVYEKEREERKWKWLRTCLVPRTTVTFVQQHYLRETSYCTYLYWYKTGPIYLCS